MNDFSWIKGFAELTMTGVVAWLVYWTFSRTFPRMAKDFQEQIKQILMDFHGQLAEERQASRDLVAAVEKNSRLLVFLVAKIAGGAGGIDDEVASALGIGRASYCKACPETDCLDCPEKPKEEDTTK